jgi:hypothetical protein
MRAGVWNGIVGAYLDVPPMIATLILMVAGLGIAQMIDTGMIITFRSEFFSAISTGQFLTIPSRVLVAVAVFVVLWLVLRRTALGLFIEAVGGNAPAADLVGIAARRIKVAAYAISGLFDLVPLVATSINKALRLDEASAKAVSPLFWTPPKGGSLDAVVGELESAEYFRQSRSIVEAWGRAGVATQFGVIADANHFTAIAPLADPASPMVARLRQLARP